jgi:hypothetical protein
MCRAPGAVVTGAASADDTRERVPGGADPVRKARTWARAVMERFFSNNDGRGQSEQARFQGWNRQGRLTPALIAHVRLKADATRSLQALDRTTRRSRVPEAGETLPSDPLVVRDDRNPPRPTGRDDDAIGGIVVERPGQPRDLGSDAVNRAAIIERGDVHSQRRTRAA